MTRANVKLPPPPGRARKIIQMNPKDPAGESEVLVNGGQAGSAGVSQRSIDAGAFTSSAAAASLRSRSGASSAPNPGSGSTGSTSRSGSGTVKKSARKTAHSIIERRRRSKMNEEFETLKDMVPACRGQSMHKLAILQAGIDYVRYLEQCISDLSVPGQSGPSRPSKSPTPRPQSAMSSSSPPLDPALQSPLVDPAESAHMQRPSQHLAHPRHPSSQHIKPIEVNEHDDDDASGDSPLMMMEGVEPSHHVKLPPAASSTSVSTATAPSDTSASPDVLAHSYASSSLTSPQLSAPASTGPLAKSHLPSTYAPNHLTQAPAPSTLSYATLHFHPSSNSHTHLGADPSSASLTGHSSGMTRGNLSSASAPLMQSASTSQLQAWRGGWPVGASDTSSPPLLARGSQSTRITPLDRQYSPRALPQLTDPPPFLGPGALGSPGLSSGFASLGDASRRPPSYDGGSSHVVSGRRSGSGSETSGSDQSNGPLLMSGAPPNTMNSKSSRAAMNEMNSHSPVVQRLENPRRLEADQEAATAALLLLNCDRRQSGGRSGAGAGDVSWEGSRELDRGSESCKVERSGLSVRDLLSS